MAFAFLDDGVVVVLVAAVVGGVDPGLLDAAIALVIEQNNLTKKLNFKNVQLLLKKQLNVKRKKRC